MGGRVEAERGHGPIIVLGMARVRKNGESSVISNRCGQARMGWRERLFEVVRECRLHFAMEMSQQVGAQRGRGGVARHRTPPPGSCEHHHAVVKLVHQQWSNWSLNSGQTGPSTGKDGRARKAPRAWPGPEGRHNPFLKLILLEQTPLLTGFGFGARQKWLVPRIINLKKHYF